MEKSFARDEEIEYVISLLHNDVTLVEKLGVGELELLNEYLTQKKEFLTENIGG